MGENTTIEIPKSCLQWWKNCCNKKGRTSAELFNDFRDYVRKKKQQEFYISLEMPGNYVKPLSGKRIEKNYRK